eukprot:5226493-Pyramimonas_sp.AAC.1
MHVKHSRWVNHGGARKCSHLERKLLAQAVLFQLRPCETPRGILPENEAPIILGGDGRKVANYRLPSVALTHEVGFLTAIQEGWGQLCEMSALIQARLKQVHITVGSLVATKLSEGSTESTEGKGRVLACK